MKRATEYILVNLAGLLSTLSGWFTHYQPFLTFGLGLIVGSNLLFK